MYLIFLTFHLVYFFFSFFHSPIGNPYYFMYREIQVVLLPACIVYQLCIKVVYFLRFNIEENLGFFCTSNCFQSVLNMCSRLFPFTKKSQYRQGRS